MPLSPAFKASAILTKSICIAPVFVAELSNKVSLVARLLVKLKALLIGPPLIKLAAKSEFAIIPGVALPERYC